MKKTIWLLLLLAVTAGGYGFYTYWTERRDAATGSEVFRVARVESMSLKRTVESTGEVQPENRVGVKSPVSGRIDTLLVRQGDTVQKGDVIAWISSTERATLLDMARAKGEEEFQHWQTIYKAAPLIAPLTGTVIARDFEPGQTMNPSDSIVVIADRLIVAGQVDESDIGAIFNGQEVLIRLDAYPDLPFRGKVASIAFDARMISNIKMYETRIDPENLPEIARSGMTATLNFVVEERRDVPVVPTAALDYRSGVPVVRVADATGRETEILPVETGLSEQGFTELIGSLREGDAVLVPEFIRAKERGTNPLLPAASRRGM